MSDEKPSFDPDASAAKITLRLTEAGQSGIAQAFAEHHCAMQQSVLQAQPEAPHDPVIDALKENLDGLETARVEQRTRAEKAEG